MKNNYFFVYALIISFFSPSYACQDSEINLFGTCINRSSFSTQECDSLQYCAHTNNINKKAFKQCANARGILHKYMKQNNFCIKFRSLHLYCPLKKYKTAYQKIGEKMKYIDEAFTDLEIRFTYLPLDLEIFNKYYQLVGVLPEDQNAVIVSSSNLKEIRKCEEFAENESVCNQWIKRFDYLRAQYLNRKFEVVEDRDVRNWGEGTEYHTDAWRNIPDNIRNSMTKIKELKKKLKGLER